MIDTWKEISEKKSTAMKGNKNAVKTYQKQSKQKKTEENSEEQNETEKTEKENKNKKEKEIILSSNEDKSASTVDKKNPEIDECLEIIKSFNGWMIDWTQKRNRIYSKNLIWKLKQSPPVSSGEYSRQETLKVLLQVISENKYHRSKITDPKKIYENLTLLFQVCNEAWTKKIPVMHAL